MKKNVLWIAGVLLLVVVVLVVVFTQSLAGQSSPQPAQNSASTDPQKLMIPRWFLNSLTLNGESITLPEKQQTIQFEEGGKANGEGGCNGFFADYEAAADGSMTFGPVGSTMMLCEGSMDQEAAYFQAMEAVRKFQVEEGKLTLSSEDGQTVLVFNMPPK